MRLMVNFTKLHNI